jgi:hypothetical protein
MEKLHVKSALETQPDSRSLRATDGILPTTLFRRNAARMDSPAKCLLSIDVLALRSTIARHFAYSLVLRTLSE